MSKFKKKKKKKKKNQNELLKNYFQSKLNSRKNIRFLYYS